MNGLLLDSLPVHFDAAKDENPSSQLAIGEIVNDTSLVQALLSYGTFDKYFYVGRPRYPKFCKDPQQYQHSERLERVDPADVGKLVGMDDLVLFTSGPNLARYVPFRQHFVGSAWPICGLTHTISNPFLVWTMAFLSATQLKPWDAVICTTESARAVLERMFASFHESQSFREDAPIRLPDILLPVIPLGVDPSTVATCEKGAARTILGLPHDSIIYLYFGRFAYTNKSDLRPILYTLLGRDELTNNSLLIVSGDDTREQLTSSLREFGSCIDSSSRLRVLPNVNSREKRLLLSAADVFISLSDTVEETFGLAIVEAMMAGLPVIASDWDGYRHLIDDNSNGFLIPTSMHEDMSEISACSTVFGCEADLAQRVCVDMNRFLRAAVELGRSPELRARLGEAARIKAMKMFTWENIVRQYERLWLRQCALSKAAGPNDRDRVRATAALFDYSKVFIHYPTCQFGDEDVVRSCETPVLRKLRLARKLFQPGALECSEDLDDHLLNNLGVPIKIGEIKRSLAKDGFSGGAVISALSRLIKYGIVEVCKETPCDESFSATSSSAVEI
jgi:D-inositol-3-phosphate glycosyltransferase